MFARKNLSFTALSLVSFFSSSLLPAITSIKEIHTEFLKVFDPTANTKISVEEKTAFENFDNPAWLELILAKTSELYGQEIEDEFMRVATTLRDKFVELDKPFQDPRYMVFGPLADSCRRITGYQTTYEAALDEYKLRQEQLNSFDFMKEKSALWQKLQPIVFFAKSLCESNFENEAMQKIVVQFCKNLIKAMVAIHEKLNSIDKSNMDTEKKLNFLELIFVLQKPIIGLPQVLGVLLKKHYKVNIFEYFSETIVVGPSFVVVAEGSTAADGEAKAAQACAMAAAETTDAAK